MSKEVKRYNFDVDKFGSPRAYESEHGRWMKRADYDVLLDENQRLESAWKVGVLNRKDELIAKQEKENDRVKAERDALLAERDALKKDAERMAFIEEHPNWLRKHKKHWQCVNPFTNYEYPVFKTAREAVDAALQGAQP